MTFRKLKFSVITLFYVLTLSACNNTDTSKLNSENISVTTTVQNTENSISDSQNDQNVNDSKAENSDSSADTPTDDLITTIPDTGSSDDIIVVEDQVFSSMVMEIYENADKYIGKTIKLTGMFDKYHDDQSDKTYFSVYRKDEMGCCSYGIEVDWDDSTGIKIPAQDQIVTATGVLDKYNENSQDYLVLHLSELKESDQ